jgi:malate synthase
MSVLLSMAGSYKFSPAGTHVYCGETLELVQVTEDDLLQMPKGKRTLEGLRLNTRVGVQYLAAWMTGTGSVPLYNLMEDAATAEISRVQNWQWIKYGAVLDGGLVPGAHCSTDHQYSVIWGPKCPAPPTTNIL